MIKDNHNKMISTGDQVDRGAPSKTAERSPAVVIKGSTIGEAKDEWRERNEVAPTVGAYEE